MRRPAVLTEAGGMTTRSLRLTGAGVLVLSLLGLLGGAAWAGAALVSDGEQSGVGVLLGGALAIACAVPTLLGLTTVLAARRHPGIATGTLVAAAALAGVVLLGLGSLFSGSL